jgi:hypothetical protein
MKQILASAGFILCCVVLSIQPLKAQDPITAIIKAGVTKVIKAIDLKIQRLQNKTIWLQNAAEGVKNKMSDLKLNEIKDWVEKQRKLYDDYFKELWKVKSVLASYHRIKEIIHQQALMISEYKTVWGLFRNDKNFTPQEINYMQKVYEGILNESLKNIDGLFLVINSYATQMSDAKRIELIIAVAGNIDKGYLDLKQFNNQNKMISLQRAAEKGEIEYVNKLYGF